ncbi:MAG: TetR/AcrR family transcriptional regulator [Bacteroidaceae bacterium]|nr:TetR/AcrR family transcriptional regulator [Bacteroidaceae bacterium]
MDNQEKRNKEQLILAAAEQEFLTKGYDGARTTSIAKTAGVTHAMLHYYFRTKEGLFERIVDEKFRIMSQSMLAVMGEPDLPTIERIRSGIAAHFDFIAKNPHLPRFLINEVVSRPERYSILQNRIQGVINILFSQLQEEIDNAAARGEMEWIDVRTLLISIMSLNIFTFVAYPFMETMLGDFMSDREKFLAERKAENINTIMCRIKTKQP